MQEKTLLVILGPTGVGKTDLALNLAERLQTEIVNADSRQIYKELPIGTAAPTAAEQKRVKHHFVGIKSVTEEYNAGIYEKEATEVIAELFKTRQTVILTGGSMMYIDAVCKGFDDIPAVSPQIRQQIAEAYRQGGLQWLQSEAQRLDGEYFSQTDIYNPQRLIHAIEVTLEAGVPYSSLRRGAYKERDFNVVKIGLFRQREELYKRIDKRVEQMMTIGLEDEARKVYHLRGMNSLNTVGYKEMFAYFDGEINREEAVRLIQQHSRNYAKRQMTWWKTPGRIQNGKNGQQPLNQDNTQSITWFDAAQTTPDDILAINTDMI